MALALFLHRIVPTDRSSQKNCGAAITLDAVKYVIIGPIAAK